MLASLSGPSIGCRKKCSKSSCSTSAGLKERLGENELELVAAAQDQLRARLRAYADPVDVRRRFARPIGFYGDPEAAFMKGFHEFVVELEQGFTTRADDETMR